MNTNWAVVGIPEFYKMWPANYGLWAMSINIFAKESSRSDWGSNPRPTATPPSTKYQRSNPLSQITILKKNGSLDSGIQGWYLSTRHVANSGELLYTLHYNLYALICQTNTNICKKNTCQPLIKVCSRNSGALKTAQQSKGMQRYHESQYPILKVAKSAYFGVGCGIW
jgi:hypothetical protein